MDIILSICMITYNQEKYIAQTLDSILNQKHNYKYEIIIGDDCSVDGTRIIIEKYVSLYPTIIKPIFNESNLGIIRNYYNVIKHCTGKYIMECAGDDYWLPGKIAYQIDYMEKHNCLLSYSKVETINQCGKKGKWGSKRITTKQILISNQIPAVSVCFKNQTIKEYISTVSPDKKTWLMEDYPFWLWISTKGKIKYIRKPFAVYRINEGSLSHPENITKLLKFEESVRDIGLFFSQDNESYKKIVNNRYNYSMAKNYYRIKDLDKFNKSKDKLNIKFKIKLRIICIKKSLFQK